MVMHHLDHNEAMNGFYRHDVSWNRILSALGYRNIEINKKLMQEIKARESAGEYDNLSLEQRTKAEFNHMLPILLDEESGFHLEPEVKTWKRELSESLHLKEALEKVYTKYLVLKGSNLSDENFARSRFREHLERGEPFCSTPITIPDRFGHSFQNYFVNFRNPVYGLHHSFWNRSESEFASDEKYPRPMRALFYLDFEYYHNFEPLRMLWDQDKLRISETMGNVVRECLLNYGIHFVEVQTGRGRNFISQLLVDSEMMDIIIKSAGALEDSVKGRAKYPEPHSRRREEVPLKTEAAYKFMCRLQQYAITQVIGKLRYHALHEHMLHTHISDCGIEGVSADPTSIVREVWNSASGIPHTPYIKFFAEHPEQLEFYPIPLRTVVGYSGKLFIDNIFDLSRIRNNLDESLEYMQSVPGFIPDGTTGLKRLIHDYLNSDLYRKVHKVMDEKEHQDPSQWHNSQFGYRRNNYGYLTPILGKSIWEINSDLIYNLKNPDVMNHFVFSCLKAGFHPKDIAGTARAIFEDGRFNWGHKFLKQDAARHANGWVELILGQLYEKSYN